MTNEDLKEYFEEKFHELEEHNVNEFVGVGLGKTYIDIVKVFDEFKRVSVSYVYNDEVIKNSPFHKESVIENLVELSYYPEINLQKLSSQLEISRKKKSLIEQIHGDINKLCKEFKPLRDKIDLYVKLYGEDNLEEKINLFMLESHMSHIHTKLNKEND